MYFLFMMGQFADQVIDNLLANITGYIMGLLDFLKLTGYNDYQ